ncbi:MAG TPA: SurA N-terminal domain-containing protein [Candidatus Saccharimonadales bacterium]|nr:SurA N-terminal domain-containing protein [Candidatus Saccharimonadales bacterium]
MVRKKISKKLKPFKKRAKEVKNLVPAAVTEKAAELNPLNPTLPEPPSLEDVPRITNENIGEHREQVLKGARKYIYPLRHSTRTIVAITLTVIITAIIGLFVYCSLALYKYYQYNTFVYRITQVVPFPIAKADGHYVNYENYLFELRRYVHYYESQQQRNFAGADHDQLVQFRKQALQKVIDDTYIKDVARKNHVSVSNKEVDARLNEVREQNRLGGNSKVFANVLRDYWGWSVNDFKRSLKQEILSEKVAAKLDITDSRKADSVAAQAKAGADFAKLAAQYSSDPAAKASGGDYGFAITKTNPNVPPEVIDQLFQMKTGQVSGVILASPILAGQGPTLQIVKLTGVSGDSVTAQHIVINLKDASSYIKQLQIKKPPHPYVHF